MIWVGLLTWLAVIVAGVVAAVRWAAGVRRMEAGIPADTRDTFVMAAAEDEMDEVDR